MSVEWPTLNKYETNKQTTNKTNVDYNFLRLVDKHFPKGSTLHKIFNRNNLKVSFSCMQLWQQSLANITTKSAGINRKTEVTEEKKENVTAV